MTGKAWAADWYVDNSVAASGNGQSWETAWKNFNNIAWSSVNPGDTVYISGGVASKTYNERLTIGTSGSEGSPITIKVGQESSHNGVVVIDGTGIGSYSGIRINDQHDITISGQVGTGSDCHIKVTNFVYAGIYISGAPYNLDIGHVEVTRNGNPQTGYTAGIQIVAAYHANFGEIHHCKIHDHGNEAGDLMSAVRSGGEDATGFGSMKIHHNDFYNFHADALKLAYDGTDFYNNTIRDRGVYFSDHPDGIQGYSNHTRIYNNHFYNFIREDDDANVNSYIRFNPDSIHYGADFHDLQIYNNLFTETRNPQSNEFLRGIEIALKPDLGVNSVNNILIANNTFNKTPFFAIGVYIRDPLGTDDVGNIKVINNITLDCGELISTPWQFRTGDGSLTFGSLADVDVDFVVDYNLMYASSDTYNDGVLLGEAVYSYSDFKAQCSHGCQDMGLVVDPLIDLNYKPVSGSPIIDVGASLASYFVIDADNVTRPQGAAWDIGAYEYQALYRADVDGSLEINTTDALLTLRNSLGLSMSGTAWQASSTTGDVNCDGISNSTDALLILRHSLGLSMSETGWCE